MEGLQPGARILLRLGPVAIADSVVFTWLVMGVFWVAAWAVCRRLVLMPGPVQVVFEGIVGACENAVKELLPRDYVRVTPFILSLWLYLAVANLLSLIPGFETPTRDLSVTSALSVLR